MSADRFKASGARIRLPKLQPDGSIQGELPERLDGMLRVIVALVRGFVADVRQLCRQVPDGDFVAAAPPHGLWDRWQVIARCPVWMSLYLGEDEQKLTEVDGGRVLHYPPGRWRELSELVMAIASAEPLPALGLGPLRVRRCDLDRLIGLSDALDRMVAGIDVDASTEVGPVGRRQPQRAPLSDGRAEIWERLAQGPQSAKELAKEIGTTSESVRQQVCTMRKLGYPIKSVPGVGYERCEVEPVKSV